MGWEANPPKGEAVQEMNLIVICTVKPSISPVSWWDECGLSKRGTFEDSTPDLSHSLLFEGKPRVVDFQGGQRGSQDGLRWLKHNASEGSYHHPWRRGSEGQ